MISIGPPPMESSFVGLASGSSWQQSMVQIIVTSGHLERLIVLLVLPCACTTSCQGSASKRSWRLSFVGLASGSSWQQSMVQIIVTSGHSERLIVLLVLPCGCTTSCQGTTSKRSRRLLQLLQDNLQPSGIASGWYGRCWRPGIPI